MREVSWVLCIVEVKNLTIAQSQDDIFIVLTENWQPKEWKKKWQLQLPGGGRDCNESFITCAQRELFEELGLKIQKNKLSHIWDDVFEIIWYQTQEQIKITAHLVYVCISPEQFEEIQHFTSNETNAIIKYNISEAQWTDRELRPWTRSHIEFFLQHIKNTIWGSS